MLVSSWLEWKNQFFNDQLKPVPCNYLVALILVFLKYPQQVKGWKGVPRFQTTHILSVPEGNYLELNFTMDALPWYPQPCLWDNYLEIRDGNNQSANVLGVFCGDHKTAVVRSSGRYLWLRFFPERRYYLNAYYTGRSFNRTGTIFLDKLSTVKAALG